MESKPYENTWDRRRSVVIRSPDGRLRVFAEDTGICLGILIHESDTDTEPIDTPVPWWQSLMIFGTIALMFILAVWLTVEVVLWVQKAP